MLQTEFKFGEVHKLADQVQFAEDHPQSQQIFETSNGGVVVMGLSNGQVLTEHVAPAELMVNVIEGSVEFTVEGKPHTINAGEFMLVGQGVAHSVVAKADSKILLVKVKQ